MLKIDYHNFDFSSPKFIRAQDLAYNASKSMIDNIKNCSPYYKIFSIDLSKKMAKECSQYCNQIRNNFSDIIVIGMGGSILNPQSLISLCQERDSNINVHFLHNTDPIFFNKLLSRVILKNCAILAISNTGNTLETNSLVGTMINEYKRSNILEIEKYFYFITNTESGILNKLANEIGSIIIPHQQQISGRYSGLSTVTSFIAQIAGIDINQFFDGANKIINNFIQGDIDSSPVRSAAFIYASKLEILVNIGYLQNFDHYLEWYAQIIAESLGKNGIGITPISGLGPNDQHSMMQLYLEGKKDKLFSLFYIEDLSSEFQTANLKELTYIANQNLAHINNSNYEATKSALIQQKLTIKTTILKDLSAKSIGELITHSMLEIITLCNIFQVNPFNQPSVELIKNNAKNLVVAN